MKLPSRYGMGDDAIQRPVPDLYLFNDFAVDNRIQYFACALCHAPVHRKHKHLRCVAAAGGCIFKTVTATVHTMTDKDRGCIHMLRPPAEAIDGITIERGREWLTFERSQAAPFCCFLYKA